MSSKADKKVFVLAATRPPLSFLGLLLSLCFCAVLSACADKAAQGQRLSAGAVVLAFGDSVTHGTGAAPGQDYPTLLASSTGWKVINAGVPGDTARAAKQRLGALLAEHQPEMVIIELGGNDFLRRRQASAVKEDLRDMVQQVRRAQSIPVLVAVPRLSLLRASVGALSDASLYAELAEEESVVLLDTVFSEVLSRDELRADQVHPNAEGYRRLSAGLLKQLRNSGF